MENRYRIAPASPTPPDAVFISDKQNFYACFRASHRIFFRKNIFFSGTFAPYRASYEVTTSVSHSSEPLSSGLSHTVRKEHYMEITPLREYPRPEYPTALEFHTDCRQLIRHIPRRWKWERTISSVLSFTIATGMCSCSLHTERSPENTVVIPLFAHGEGRGSYGCESVAPPVYLSEDEAAQVIRETAREYGLDFSGTGTVSGERLPYTNLYGDTTATWSGELPLDGYDEETGLGYLFVSQDDVENWAKDSQVYSTVASYDMKGTAERLTDTLQNTAVFYDPGIDTALLQQWWQDWNQTESEKYTDRMEKEAEYTAAQKAQMEEKLRAQVIDFIAWLQTQGIL